MQRVLGVIPVLMLAATPLVAQGARSAASGTVAASAALRVARAGRLTGEIHLDGRLDEPAWQAAEVSGGFVQSYPSPGAPAPDPSEVRILFDEKSVYVGIRMFDAHPDSIAAQLARRDASGIYSDWVHLIIDSYHDRRTAFRFSVNPRGVQKDVYTSNDGNEDVNWDAVWHVATRVDSAGWVAEYQIPLSQLRFAAPSGGAEMVWGFQVMRDIARRQERDSWSPWTTQSPGFVSMFGDLRGLAGVSPPRRLELLPYSSMRGTHAPGSKLDPFYSSFETRANAGLDLRYGLPKGLTLTGTVNPDFGQVEVDPAVVNLSAFETFFPEKRPFFIEGSDAFTFGRVFTYNDYGSQQYFYSRRIGRSPQRFVGGPDVQYVDAPTETTIAAAAKITGKNGPWSVGILDAFTPTENARIIAPDGTRSSSPVEPSTNYFAGRLRRDFRRGATVVGAMFTSTRRSVDAPEFENLLRSGAVFGGVDFEHRIRNRAWVLSGFLAGSRVNGSAPVMSGTQQNSTHYYQRPDASYLTLDNGRTSLGGHIGELVVAKTGSYFGSVGYKEMSPGFEINDLGFQGRADFRALSTLVGYQSSRAGRVFRSVNAILYQNATWNFGGNSIYQGYAANANVSFRNTGAASVGVTLSPEVMSDRFTRGGPLARVPSSRNLNLFLSTDSRKLIILNASASYFHDASGASSRSLNAGFDTRPTSFIHITAQPGISKVHGTGQFVRSVADASAGATYGRRYVFADLDQTTVSMTTRVEWTFTPTLSFQLYAQPFISSGRYTGHKEFTAPRTYDFAVYGSDRGTISRDPATRLYTVDPDGAGPAAPFQFADPDFNLRSLRGNAVLRWEYRPGSAVYVVWQQQRAEQVPLGDFDFGRDVGAMFRAPATNVFLVKISYWLGS